MDVTDVYAAQRDTSLLRQVLDEVLRAAVPRPDPCRVLELGVGSGALAVRAATHPGTDVTGIDVNAEALRATAGAAERGGVAVRLLEGDLTAPVLDETFDLVISNPPYVPAPTAGVPLGGPARAWDAGLDGRAVLDRLCRQVRGVLAPGGEVLIVQSALSGVDATRGLLERAGLSTRVAARCTHPFGPVLTERAVYLERAGLIESGCRTEELVVIHAQL